MLSPAQAAGGIPAHPLHVPLRDTIHPHTALDPLRDTIHPTQPWIPAHRKTTCNWRLQNKLPPRCGHFPLGILIEFFCPSKKEGPEMGTGELCHGCKNGRKFQVLALVMLGLLSVLCSAAGLRGQSWAGTEMRISPAPRHSPASLPFSLLASQGGRHLISSLITRPNEMSAANTQVFKCCWNACRCQQSLRQGIIPVNSLTKVTKAVQGPRRPLTFICPAEGALVLPPLLSQAPGALPQPSLPVQPLEGSSASFKTSANV